MTHPTLRRVRRMRRLLPTVSALLLPTVLAGGCAVYAAGVGVGATAGAITGNLVTSAGAAVSVSLEPARDVAAVDVRHDTIWVHRAHTLLGRVSAARGDSLWIALSEATGAAGTERFARQQSATATIVRSPGVAVKLVSGRPEVAEVALLGAALGLLATLFALYLYCSSQRCLD